MCNHLSLMEPLERDPEKSYKYDDEKYYQKVAFGTSPSFSVFNSSSSYAKTKKKKEIQNWTLIIDGTFRKKSWAINTTMKNITKKLLSVWEKRKKEERKRIEKERRENKKEKKKMKEENKKRKDNKRKRSLGFVSLTKFEKTKAIIRKKRKR